MSVIIKGATMPRTCVDCPLFRESAYGFDFCKGKGIGFVAEDAKWIDATRPNWCPLVELPEEHGRLIDADDMERFMSDTVQGDIRQYPYSDTLWDMAFKWIDSRPTIVEAEGD